MLLAPILPFLMAVNTNLRTNFLLQTIHTYHTFIWLKPDHKLPLKITKKVIFLTLAGKLVKHFFFVDQMGSFINKLHQFIQVVGPTVEDLVGILVRCEIYDSS